MVPAFWLVEDGNRFWRMDFPTKGHYEFIRCSPVAARGLLRSFLRQAQKDGVDIEHAWLRCYVDHLL